MSKKTSIDKAVEQLEKQMRFLTADYEARRAGLEAAIDAVRQQQRKAPKPRATKPQAVPRTEQTG